VNAVQRNRCSRYLFGMISFVVLMSATFSVRAQTPLAPSPTPTPRPTPSLERQFFRNILRDQKAIWTAPFKLKKDDAKWLMPAGVGTMALVTTDRNTGDEISEFDDLEKPSRIVSYAGSLYTVAGVATTFYLVGRNKNNARARETGILAGEAIIDSLIVVSALKGITQRGRPNDPRDRSEFFDGGSSFPSGHSAHAWALATVVADEYHDHLAVRIAAFSIATAVSVARYTAGKHYLSDVLVGSALGYGIGQYVYHTHHREMTQHEHPVDRESHWPAITPNLNRRTRQYGVALTWSF
jgi:hypothetical protein